MNSRHRSFHSIAQARQSSSALVAVAPVPASPPSAQWLGRNLDFCLLAFCSCLLAVLCHQSIILPSAQANSGSQMAISRVSPSQLDFLLKAGLFTSAKSQSEPDEETE